MYIYPEPVLTNDRFESTQMASQRQRRGRRFPHYYQETPFAASAMLLLTPWAAASLARNDAIGHAALRGWLVAGPFEDANATGLERSFPPEAATRRLDSPNQSLE